MTAAAGREFRVLFVDDEPRVLDGVRRAMHACRASWSSRFVIGGAEALAELARQDADVVLTDMRMPGMDGALLLEEIARRHPHTIRIVLSGQADHTSALRAVRIAHGFLAKPVATPALHATIARLAAACASLDDQHLRTLAARINVLPVSPAIYAELRHSLQLPNANIGAIARCAEQDPALSAKLLQLVNSAFFFQAIETTSVDDALRVLGLELFRQLLETDDMIRASAPRDSDAIAVQQARSLAEARMIRRIAPQPIAEDAYMSALLAGLGRLALGELRQDDGDDAGALTRYLIAIWGLPLRIASAAERRATVTVAA